VTCCDPGTSVPLWIVLWRGFPLLPHLRCMTPMPAAHPTPKRMGAGTNCVGEVCVPSSRSDWARGTSFMLIWWLPIAFLVLSSWTGGRLQLIAWPTLLAWMGAACLLNARRCRRLHCYLTGPYLLLLALSSLLYGLGVIPLGARGWSMLSVALAVGGLFLFYVPEWLFGRYLGLSSNSLRR
jgi:hypothetical protein